MTRRLSHDETALWDRLRETVKPLRKRLAKPPKAEAEAVASPGEPTKPARRKAQSAPPAPAAAAPLKQKTPSPPSLAPLEEKTRRRLGRGLVEIDDRIDLHGMRQERAFTMLASFLRHAQAQGAKIVLVVTGKGRTGEGRATEGGRGVLREVVPAWLARDDLRAFVVGFEEAARRHGGAGALYVRIRRRRAGGARPPA